MKRSRPPSVLEVDAPSCESTEDVAESVERYDAASQGSLVGDVLDKAPMASPGRVLVRWRTVDGILNESPLRVVRGLSLDNGDLVVLNRPSNWPEWLVTHVIEGIQQSRADGSTAVRGRRLEIEGTDEVVLRCGEASITLRRNGRVVMRGTYVESRSKGTNRIKGGVVLIN
jgi:hypothetical protein